MRRPRRSSAQRGTRRSRPTGPSCSRSIVDPEVPPLPPHITLRAGEEDGEGDRRRATRARRRDGEVASGGSCRRSRSRSRAGRSVAVATSTRRRRRAPVASRRTRSRRTRPESDGTLEWDSTTIVVVEVRGAAARRASAARTARRPSPRSSTRAARRSSTGRARSRPGAAQRAAAHVACGTRAIPGIGAWRRVRGRRRALGSEGAAARTCRSRRSSPRAHDAVPVYGSGGFARTRSTGCASSSAAGSPTGIPRVKMKVGREPERDRERVSTPRARRSATTPSCTSTRTARSRRSRRSRWARALRARVGRDVVRGAGRAPADLDGLRLVRERAPAGWTSPPASTRTCPPTSATCSARVDCLQADVTRCGGITGLLARRRLRRTRTQLDLSGPLRAAAPRARALRGADAAPPRVVPRPRAHRAACSSTASSSRRTARCGPTGRGPGHGLELRSAPTRERYAAGMSVDAEEARARPARHGRGRGALRRRRRARSTRPAARTTARCRSAS